MGEAKNRKNEINNLKNSPNPAFTLRKTLKKYINLIENHIETGTKLFNAEYNEVFHFSDDDITLAFAIGVKEAGNMMKNIPANKLHELITDFEFVSNAHDYFTEIFGEIKGHKTITDVDDTYCVDISIPACSQLATSVMVETINRVLKAA